MKKITFLLVLFGAVVQAQTFQWLRTPEMVLPYNPDMTGITTTCDPDGNVYFSGLKDNAHPNFEICGNLYFNKYSAGGELLFSKIIYGKADPLSMVADTEGNLYMLVSYINEITIDDFSESKVNQEPQWLLVKFSPDGNLLWHHEFYMEYPDTVNLNVISECRALALDAQNNIYVGYDTYMDGYITKLSPSGDELLTISEQNSGRLTSVSVDSEGNIFAAGSCASFNAVYAGVPAPVSFLYNNRLVKYSASGQYLWSKYVEDITCTEPHVVAYSPDAVYFSSVLYGAFSFDDITLEGSSTFADFFLAKINGNGTYQWVREVPGDGEATPGNRNFLNVDASGNIYFSGRTRNTVNWGNGITTSSGGWGNTGLILKYNPEGEVVMAKTAGDQDFTTINSISLNADNDIFIGGIAIGASDFDDIHHETGEMDYYPFLAKMSQGELSLPDTEGNTPLLYPNPANEYFILANSNKTINGVIVNPLGQVVKNITIEPGRPVYINDLAQGTYLIKPDGFRAVKLVKP